MRDSNRPNPVVEPAKEATGSPHAKVQIEGKIVDIKRGELVATFAERRRSSGAIGMDDLAGDSETGLIELMIKSIS